MGTIEPIIYKNISRDKITEGNLNYYPKNAVAGESDPIYEELVSEESKDFIKYIERLHLAAYRELMVLSSSRHYYYDAEELKDVRTLVNLKQLNQINQFKDFLQTVFQLLPLNSYFIGCFCDYYKNHELIAGSDMSRKRGNRWFAWRRILIAAFRGIMNRIWRSLGFRINRFMTKKSVTSYLEECGLMVMDITEIEGLTYFCTQKIQRA